MYVPVGIRIKLTVRIPVLQDLVELEDDGWTFGLCGWLCLLSLKRILVKPIPPGGVT